jgi:hypothetical protein
MKSAKLATLRFVALLFLLPGLGGLILSAVVSTHYLDTLPRWPTPEQERMIPRNIHGIVVYQTAQEEHRLTLLEDSSVGIFVLGLGLSVWYLEQWSSLRTRESEQDDDLTEDYG